MNKKFDKELHQLGISLTDEQKEKFERYYKILIEWNQVMNLTSITDYDEVNLKHFSDSLTIIRVCETRTGVGESPETGTEKITQKRQVCRKTGVEIP